ncbi:hypothetical protein HN011_003720 [Eciton burchellii]|nr:hypothetical protein HN011_003720 [Eciton burchellii]
MSTTRLHAPTPAHFPNQERSTLAIISHYVYCRKRKDSGEICGEANRDPRRRQLPIHLLEVILIGLQVPPEYAVQYPPLAPMSTGGIPNSLGLRMEIEPRHFVGGGLVNIKCIAQVGLRSYSEERKVLMAFLNNQRLSAGDHMHAAARSIRSGLLAPLLTVTLALVLLAT